MKILSFNVKGLDPSKAKKVKEWFRQQGHFDAVVFTEVKCAGKALLQRLTFINNQLTWIVSTHSEGAGGVACGLKSNWSNQIRASHIDSQNQWVAFELASLVLIGIYANSPQAYRGRI